MNNEALAAITGFIWVVPAYVGIFTQKKYPDGSIKVFLTAMLGAVVWAVAWLVVVGVWIARHLCY